MNANELLCDLRARDVNLSEADGFLALDAPDGVLTSDVRTQLLRHKYELLAIIESDDQEISWRIDALRPLIPPRGPLLPPVIRRNRATAQGGCHCCGDPMSDEGRLRCSPCSRAMWFVINEVREGVVVPPGGLQRTESWKPVARPAQSVRGRHMRPAYTHNPPISSA